MSPAPQVTPLTVLPPSSAAKSTRHQGRHCSRSTSSHHGHSDVFPADIPASHCQRCVSHYHVVASEMLQLKTHGRPS